ncbi:MULTISPECIES: DASH family cryptochrome [Pseudoalteromonas]|uniref:Cryptochrome DASH n=1 Tax=Pseudoalteromonas amylolytica TaxID=1859457 RepID=A0A1S1MSK4_9GAMM|nr:MULTISPECIES: DASH family cryptochrome [Pseudoalteromonas]OHU88140.1 hypothetical protein BFC16_12175 [Pseudoalteromonas sp. JW3]OHU91580.1 hypothetical protein BET10_12295 [Pseudoalteromonas amylolytica]
MSRALYWFTQDLRLTCNQGVDWATKAHDEVVFVYVINPSWFAQNNYNHMAVGTHRWRFVCDALKDLSEQLRKFGHHLHLLVGEPSEKLTEFIESYNIEALVLSQQFGIYEQRILERICQRNESVTVKQFSQTTLFNNDQVEELEIPMRSFSTFRNFVEKRPLEIFTKNVFQHPAGLQGTAFLCPEHAGHCSEVLSKMNDSIVPFDTNGAGFITGGEHRAQHHLKTYFESYAPSTYKETRNELDGFSKSTKFSAYLAIGNLSPKQIWLAIEEYERNRHKNDSTYWLKFELLWREYFQWLIKVKGKSFFLFNGGGNSKPLTSFYSRRFAAWCAGQTSFPLVNACMRQLNETGYMSNRGRQIVASCLVNELSVDWRYGAAYFQQQLIDYDVASNWGNWQYIAGVGVDPRGGRHFNIPKQAQLYDPDGEFVKKWRGHAQKEIAYDGVDESDWPLPK